MKRHWIVYGVLVFPLGGKASLKETFQQIINSKRLNKILTSIEKEKTLKETSSFIIARNIILSFKECDLEKCQEKVNEYLFHSLKNNTRVQKIKLQDLLGFSFFTSKKFTEADSTTLKRWSQELRVTLTPLPKTIFEESVEESIYEKTNEIKDLIGEIEKCELSKTHAASTTFELKNLPENSDVTLQFVIEEGDPELEDPELERLQEKTAEGIFSFPTEASEQKLDPADEKILFNDVRKEEDEGSASEKSMRTISSEEDSADNWQEI
ncbi:MAG: hypothetical protein BGO07_05040 [Alphaproteobacteria bacterium 40-19]|nr:MAG: hypothetical protein BGO07_05040 [Alphaproteobacteria bacterium 40-19]